MSRTEENGNDILSSEKTSPAEYIQETMQPQTQDITILAVNQGKITYTVDMA